MSYIKLGGAGHRQRHPGREEARAQAGEVQHHDVRLDRIREDIDCTGVATELTTQVLEFHAFKKGEALVIQLSASSIRRLHGAWTFRSRSATARR